MAFNAPISTIPAIPLTPVPSDWVRPSDWIPITDTAKEVQFLVADTGAKCFSINTQFTRTTGNIYIDWGDGVVDTISTIALTTTNHIYSTTGTPCSRGYTMFKIRVYGDSTTTITRCHHIAPTAVNSNKLYNIGLLEAYYGDGCCHTSVAFPNYIFANGAAFGAILSYGFLEYIKFPSVSTFTAYLYMFQSNPVYKIIMPTSIPTDVLMYLTFTGCSNLREIIMPNDCSFSQNFGDTFSGCTNLKKVSLPGNTTAITSWSGMFNGCSSLQNFTVGLTNNSTSFATMFQNCTSLQWVKFTSLPTVVATTFQSAFIGCTSLQNVYFPSTTTSTSIVNGTTMFSGCNNLKSINFPTGFNASTMASAFFNCSRLSSVIFNSSMASLTTFQSTFQNCSNLKEVTFPITVGGSINLTSTFQGCSSLESITLPTSYKISAAASTFQNCINLKTVTLSNDANTSFGAISTFSNCFKLESIIVPESYYGINSLAGAFQNCYSLKSIVLPSTMNVCSSMSSAFNGCTNLTSITIPASMNLCTTFANAFQNCANLKSIALPSTISAANTTYVSAFNGCISLTSITFPTTQNTSLTTLTSMFESCYSLTTLVNTDKLGSLTTTPLVTAALGSNVMLLPSLSFNCPFSLLSMAGMSATILNKLNSVRLLNASAGQYTGTSPQINFSYCDLGIAALNQLFTDLPTVTTKTINITGCTGAAGCTRTIATAKGWTVTG